MTRESAVDGPKGKEGTSSFSSWCIILVILAAIAGAVVWGWGVAQDQKAREVKLKSALAQKEGELITTKGKLAVCEAKPACEKKKVKAKKRIHQVRTAPPKPAPAPAPVPVPVPAPVLLPSAEAKKFDPSVCGEGTEAVIDKASGEPHCRAIVTSPSVTPVAPPTIAPVSQASRDCYRDGYGRLMCRGAQVRSSGSSWVPWALGGAGVLAIIANNRRHHDAPSSSPAPALQGVGTSPGLQGIETR